MACERWLWVRADGTATRELTQWVNGTEVQKGIKGRYAPKTVIDRDVIPDQPGARTRNRRHDWRPFPLPLAARGASKVALEQVLAQLAQDMDPLDGPGILRHVGVDGHTCDFIAVQTADLDPDVWLGSTGPAGQFCVLQFEADEPYFLRDEVTGFVQGKDPKRWFGIGGTGYWTPAEFGASALLGDFTINAASDAQKIYPIWTIIGPGANPVFTNHRFDETWSLPGVSLDVGQAITVDLTPGVSTILGPNGENWFPYLDIDLRALWPFYKGDNQVTVTLTGSTSASYVGWRYRPRKFAP